MELFLLYAMVLTIVAFFSIVMASPKAVPVASHEADRAPAIPSTASNPNQANNIANRDSVIASDDEALPGLAPSSPITTYVEHTQQTLTS